MSEWTPGSGFIGFAVEETGKRERSKRMPLKAKRLTPVATMKGRPLDLSTGPVALDFVKEPLGKQRFVSGKLDVDNGLLISENTSTQNRREKRSLQPAEDADPFKVPSQRASMSHSSILLDQSDSNTKHDHVTTNDYRFQQSGWLKRAKKVGFTTPSGLNDHKIKAM